MMRSEEDCVQMFSAASTKPAGGLDDFRKRLRTVERTCLFDLARLADTQHARAGRAETVETI
jgi:hypothetical protein